MLSTVLDKLWMNPLNLFHPQHTSTLSSDEVQRRDTFCTSILPVICDLLPRISPELFGSSHTMNLFFRIWYPSLECEEPVLREILSQDTASPFLLQLIQNAAVYFSRPDVDQPGVFSNLMEFLAPLAFLDVKVYQLCKVHLVPHFERNRRSYFKGIPTFEYVETHRGDQSIGLEWRKNFIRD